MTDEIGGSELNDLNTWWQVRENTNKVTEEAIRRIQENQKKAQQIGQDIKKDKDTNSKFAKFLTFLLKDIKNDTLIKQIYITFFKTINEKTALTHIRKNMNTLMMIGMFIPFYQGEIKDLGLDAVYQEIWDFDGEVYLTKYIDYIKVLLLKYHDNISIDKKQFTKLITSIAEYYQLTEKLSPENTIEFENTIQKELSLNE